MNEPDNLIKTMEGNSIETIEPNFRINYDDYLIKIKLNPSVKLSSYFSFHINIHFEDKVYPSNNYLRKK